MTASVPGFFNVRPEPFTEKSKILLNERLGRQRPGFVSRLRQWFEVRVRGNDEVGLGRDCAIDEFVVIVISRDDLEAKARIDEENVRVNLKDRRQQTFDLLPARRPAQSSDGFLVLQQDVFETASSTRPPVSASWRARKGCCRPNICTSTFVSMQILIGHTDARCGLAR